MIGVEAAKIIIDGGQWLCLKTRDTDAAKRIADEVTSSGKPYEASVKRKRKRRSLDANAYLWVLVDKIAEAIGAKKETVYRSLIRDTGGVSQIVKVEDDALEKMCSTWNRLGLGYFAEAFPSLEPGHTNVILYYGSSSYDSAQMARLIDAAIQDCQSMGIETKPDAEIKSLLETWHG